MRLVYTNIPAVVSVMHIHLVQKQKSKTHGPAVNQEHKIIVAQLLRSKSQTHTHTSKRSFKGDATGIDLM